LESLQNEFEIISASLAQLRLQNLGLHEDISMKDLTLSQRNLDNRDKHEIAQLRIKIASMDEHLAATVEQYSREIKGLSVDIDSKRDYEKVKSRLAAFLQSDLGISESDSAEEAMIKKIRKLESELVNVRLEQSKISQANFDLNHQISNKQVTIEELQATLNQYEKLAQSLSNFSPDQSMDDAASITHFNSDDIITVLTNQRERLKKRNNDLEMVFADMYSHVAYIFA